MINALASGVLVWGTLAMAGFCVGFFIWAVLSNRKWQKEQREKKTQNPLFQ